MKEGAFSFFSFRLYLAEKKGYCDFQPYVKFG